MTAKLIAGAIVLLLLFVACYLIVAAVLLAWGWWTDPDAWFGRLVCILVPLVLILIAAEDIFE